jgi:hypothetical protein
MIIRHIIIGKNILKNVFYRMKYIYHHLGLGDHIICNGLVRTLIRDDENYKMFVKPHNKISVEFMYRDLKNLSFIEGDDAFANSYIINNRIDSNDLIIAGFYTHPNAIDFDDSFYLQNNINFEKRWSAFKVIRDVESELKLFKKYDVIENEYVFIHDDHDRNLYINEEHIINKNLKIIRPQKGFTDNIFDYCYLMEKSAESHFMDSSFRLIFDSLKLRDTNIFYHMNYDSINRATNKSQSILNFEKI